MIRKTGFLITHTIGGVMRKWTVRTTRYGYGGVNGGTGGGVDPDKFWEKQNRRPSETDIVSYEFKMMIIQGRMDDALNVLFSCTSISDDQKEKILEKVFPEQFHNS
jgi:hypothetical protein